MTKNKDISEVVLGCIGALVYVIGIIVANVIISGWALATLWNWFIVPVFAAPELSLVRAMGISVVLGIILIRDNGTKDERDMAEKLRASISAAIISPVLLVGIGWVVLQFWK